MPDVGSARRSLLENNLAGGIEQETEKGFTQDVASYNRHGMYDGLMFRKLASVRQSIKLHG